MTATVRRALEGSDAPLCAPQGQTAGLGNKETLAPSEDGLAGLGLEDQKWLS